MSPICPANEIFRAAIVSVCLLLGSATSGLSASIGGNFIGRSGGTGAILSPTESAGVFPQTFWNNIDSGDPVVPGSSLALIDSAGNFTAVKILYVANDAWNSDGGTGTPNEKLMKGIIKANPDPDLAPINNTERMSFTITNLPAGSTYAVIVYLVENGAGGKIDVTLGTTTYYVEEQNSFTAFGAMFVAATSTTAGAYELGPSYAGFTNVAAAANGTITITAKKLIEDNGGGVQINDGIGVAGIQILQSAGPTPAANTDTCSITSNPQTTYAVVGGTATFTVGTQGPNRIRWTKNNLEIPGEFNSTLVLTPALSDDGAQIRAVVYNNVITNTSAPATLNVDPNTPPVLTQGFLKYERWTGLSGTAVQPVKDAIAAATPPNTVDFVAGPDVPQTAPNLSDFGVRISGWLKPDFSGEYHFFIRSDDASQLFLNSVNPGSGTNTLPDVTTDVPICEEADCCDGFYEPGTDAATTATPIFLEAGKLYGFAAILKEGGGGDYVQVAWRLTNSPTPAGSLKPIPPVYFWTMASGAGQRASITTQPASTQVVEGRTASFNVDVTTLPTPGLFGVQWVKNGSPVPGATAARYTTPPTTLADSNSMFQAIAYTLRGPLTSSPAILTVLPDTFPPVPSAGAITRADGAIQVGVGFDEPVNQADLVPGNFSLIGGATATVRFPTNSYGDYKGVLIDTTGLAAGNTYTARVANVRDLKGNAIPSTGVDAPFTVAANKSWAESGVPIRPGQVVPVGADGFDILNGGRKEWEAYDEVTMAYVKKTNDFDVRVQVVYAEPGSQWTRVGLMARNQLDVGEGDGTGGVNPDASAYAQTHVNPSQTIWSANRIDPTGLTPANTGANNGHEQNQRLGLGLATSGWGSPAGTPNYPNEWLRLQRQGTSLHGYRGQDGVTWIDQGTTTLTDQQPDMFVGPFLAVETANIWTSTDFAVFTSPFDPKFDRLFLAQFRNFGDVAPAAARPTLSFSRSGGDLVITYTGVLQSSTVVTGPYNDVSGASSPYSATTMGPARYFRARSN